MGAMDQAAISREHGCLKGSPGRVKPYRFLRRTISARSCSLTFICHERARTDLAEQDGSGREGRLAQIGAKFVDRNTFRY